MTRKDVKLIAARLNNPTLLLAIQRHDYHNKKWEDVMNEAVIELAKQNEYFLEKLVSRDDACVPIDRPTGLTQSLSPDRKALGVMRRTA